MIFYNFALKQYLLWERFKNNSADAAHRQGFRAVGNLVAAKIKLAKDRYFTGGLKNVGNQSRTRKTINQLIGKYSTSSRKGAVHKHFGDSIGCEELRESFNDALTKLAEVLPSKMGTQSQEICKLYIRLTRNTCP